MFQPRKSTEFVVVHCSATPPSLDWGRTEIDRSHRQRGFTAIGYHYVIKRDGTVEKGRPENTVGAHVEGYNSRSLGICLVGGVDAAGKPQDNFTDAQWAALIPTLRSLKHAYPLAKIVGHRDLSPDKNKDGKVSPHEWLKSCPCFDVAQFLKTHSI